MTARDRLDWIDRLALDRRVSAHAFRLAHVLQSRFVSNETGEAWPAQQTLAELLHTNERQVRYWLKELAVAGYLEVRRGGRGKPNHYGLTGSKATGQGTALTGSATADHSQTPDRLTGSENHLDRQCDYTLTGSATAGDSRLDLEEELGDQRQAGPWKCSKLDDDQSSTFEGSRDAGPPAASPTSRLFAKGVRRISPRRPDLGEYTVEDVYPEQWKVKVRWARNGQLMTLKAPPDAQFEADVTDLTSNSEDDRGPF